MMVVFFIGTGAVRHRLRAGAQSAGDDRGAGRARLVRLDLPSGRHGLAGQERGQPRHGARRVWRVRQPRRRACRHDRRRPDRSDRLARGLLDARHAVGRDRPRAPARDRHAQCGRRGGRPRAAQGGVAQRRGAHVLRAVAYGVSRRVDLPGDPDRHAEGAGRPHSGLGGRGRARRRRAVHRHLSRGGRAADSGGLARRPLPAARGLCAVLSRPGAAARRRRGARRACRSSSPPPSWSLRA